MAKDILAWRLKLKQPLHNYCYLRLYLTLVFIVANENPLLAIYISKYPSKPYIPKHISIISYIFTKKKTIPVLFIVLAFLLCIVPLFELHLFLLSLLLYLQLYQQVAQIYLQEYMQLILQLL